ncbi:hypothetical protein V8C26DRAFT_360711 [Trichoderma gracile]
MCTSWTVASRGAVLGFTVGIAPATHHMKNMLSFVTVIIIDRKLHYMYPIHPHKSANKTASQVIKPASSHPTMQSTTTTTTHMTNRATCLKCLTSPIPLRPNATVTKPHPQGQASASFRNTAAVHPSNPSIQRSKSSFFLWLVAFCRSAPPDSSSQYLIAFTCLPSPRRNKELHRSSSYHQKLCTNSRSP